MVYIFFDNNSWLNQDIVMGYYIKVSFNNKTKKFIVHNPK